jgi:hypothetical protein
VSLLDLLFAAAVMLVLDDWDQFCSSFWWGFRWLAEQLAATFPSNVESLMDLTGVRWVVLRNRDGALDVRCR